MRGQPPFTSNPFFLGTGGLCIGAHGEPRGALAIRGQLGPCRAAVWSCLGGILTQRSLVIAPQMVASPHWPNATPKMVNVVMMHNNNGSSFESLLCARLGFIESSLQLCQVGTIIPPIYRGEI